MIMFNGKLKLFFIFAILLGVGAYSAANLYELPQTRKVASLSFAQPVNVDSEPDVIKVKDEYVLGCEDLSNMSDLFETTAQMVMIKATDCAGVQLLGLENTSNGYQGQFFQLNKALKKSEYIQLSQGENLIRVEARLLGGQKTEKIIKIHQKIIE